MSIRAHDITHFTSETQEISREEAEARGNIATATLTSGEVFAAEINKFMNGKGVIS